MISMHGMNDFNDRYSFYKWSAPIYETPKEVLQHILSLKVIGKKLKNISVIGTVYDIGGVDDGNLYQKLLTAGIEPEEEWWNTYEHIDNMLVLAKGTVCEPIQFVFEDNTTLEILPMNDGSARIGLNTMPIGITAGINKSNFESSFFCEFVKGCELLDFCIRKIEKTETVIDKYALEHDKLSEDFRTKYRYEFSFSNDHNITLVHDWTSCYTVEIEKWNRGIDVPYAKVKAAQIPVKQIEIISGRYGGGTFWIVPTTRDNTDSDVLFGDNCGVSIDDIEIAEFLRYFLMKYFDKTIQNEEEHDYDTEYFDWYGSNLYTFDMMKKMISDIQEVTRLLETDYDNPALTEIKSCFRFSTFASEVIDKKMSADEAAKLFQESIHKNIWLAIDFYQRFSAQMLEMMEHFPCCDMISFTGP